MQWQKIWFIRKESVKREKVTAEWIIIGPQTVPCPIKQLFQANTLGQVISRIFGTLGSERPLAIHDVKEKG